MSRELRTLDDRGLLKATGGASHGAATFVIPGTYSWVVPAGVTEVAIVCVGAGGVTGGTAGGSSHVKRGATTLCLGVGGGSGDTAVRDGGGDGSARGAAGGYSANGNSGSGGAAADDSNYGGGVGLWGEGPSGTTGTVGGGSGGSDGIYSGIYIAGFAGGGYYAYGGGLSYKNNVAVTPGETLTVAVGQHHGGSSVVAAPGGVNIVWGRGSFPNLDGISFSGSNITIGDPT